MPNTFTKINTCIAKIMDSTKIKNSFISNTKDKCNDIQE